MDTAPWLRMGFRPFFLLASVWAALIVPLWALHMAGWIDVPGALTPTWHGHEMLGGFALAVVAGFLLTAVRNWTGEATASGAALAVLAGLWAIARLVVWVVGLGLAAWTIECAFFLGLAAAIGRPLYTTRNLRNAVFPALLVGWAGIDLALHSRPDLASWSLQREIDVVVVMLVVVTGRIVPAFTRNALPEAGVVAAPRWERAALVLALIALLLELARAPSAVLGVAWLLLAISAMLRARRWRPWATRVQPILAVLHLGHAWLVLGLLARALVAFGTLAPTVATHVLGVGAIGTLVLAMISRVALGHTGRPIEAAIPTVAAYTLLTMAAILRLEAALAGVPLLIGIAGLCFGLAFALYAWVYAPILVGPRADGRSE